MGRKEPIKTILLGVPLTKFEDDVLSLIENGLTDAEIADKLGYTQRTISNLISRSILTKLNVGSRTEVSAWWAKASFINATHTLQDFRNRLNQSANLRVDRFPQVAFEELQNLNTGLEIVYHFHPDPDWQMEVIRLKAQTFLELARIHHDTIQNHNDIKRADPYNQKALSLAKAIKDDELIGASRLSIAERHYCAGKHDNVRFQLNKAKDKIQTITHLLWYYRFSSIDHALHQERRPALRAIHKGLELMPDAIAYKLDSLLGFLEGAALALTLLSHPHAIEFATITYDNAVEKLGQSQPMLLRRGQIARTRILVARKWQMPVKGEIDRDIEWEYAKSCSEVYSRYANIFNTLAEKESYLHPERRKVYGKW